MIGPPHGRRSTYDCGAGREGHPRASVALAAAVERGPWRAGQLVGPAEVADRAPVARVYAPEREHLAVGREMGQRVGGGPTELSEAGRGGLGLLGAGREPGAGQ